MAAGVSVSVMDLGSHVSLQSRVIGEVNKHCVGNNGHGRLRNCCSCGRDCAAGELLVRNLGAQASRLSYTVAGVTVVAK